MSFNKNKPYNDLPLLPPKQEVETKAILKAAALAHQALGELKGIGGIIPNQSLLIDSIVLQEAKDSSEIENIFTTNDKLYQANNSNLDKYDLHTKEVLWYKQALWHGVTAIKKRPLSVPIIEDICKIIRQTDEGIRKTTGTHIASGKEIIYTPPEGEAVIREKLENLLEFLHNDTDIDPLVKLAIIHYQFEAIHPFSDGNGRTGRIINILYLLIEGLLDMPVLYLSRYIIKNKNDYYQNLSGVTENKDWEAWILYILHAVHETALHTKKTILSIQQLLFDSQEKIKNRLPKIYSKELVELLFDQPYCKIKFLETAGIAKRQAASEYLKQLEAIGLLRSEKVGRETIYLNYKLLALLSEVD